MTKFKAGQKVRCKAGFNGHSLFQFHKNTDPTYGGSGYICGRIFVISRISINRTGRNIIWPSDGNGNGIYEDALESLTGMCDYIPKFKFV